jgi:hypothetical protein
MNSKIIYPELSYEILNVAFEVHNALGPGFIEEIYEEAWRMSSIYAVYLMSDRKR